MTTFDPTILKAEATKVAGRFVCSDDCSAGSVAAAILSQSAIAEMLKRRQTKIVAVIAVTANGEILPSCGRCRELIRWS